MIQQTIATVKSNIDLHLLMNMQIKNNPYGARVGLDHKDQWLTLKVPTKLTDPVNGVILEYVNGQNCKAEWRTVNQQNFARFFDTNNYSYSDFLSDLRKSASLVVAEYVKEANSKTEASMALESANDSDVQYRTKTFNLFSTGQFSNQYTQADKDFIFDKVFRDCTGNFYFNLEGKLWPLEFKSNTERTVQGNGMNNETNFWPAFFRTYSKQIDTWNQEIVKALITYDPSNIGKSIEEYLMDQGIPRIYMECIILVKTERGEVTYGDNGKASISWYPEKIDVQLDTGSSNHSWKYSNQVDVFSKTLFQAIDADRVKLIPTFSNDPNEIAVRTLPALLPQKCDKVPKLPEWWDKFLGGDRFYDPIMDKMKIACAVHNTYKANYSGRQVLVIGGDGDDGKGTFIKVLEDVVGDKFSVTCSPKDFDGENRFALSKIFNKKFVVLPDCKYVSKLFAYDDFKKLTGYDSLDLDRKYSSSIKYIPKGVTCMIATNNPFYLTGEHGKSRAVPVVFRKNYKWNTFVEKDVMISNLLSEKQEFIQWCEDYRMFLNSKCNGALLKGDKLRICSDEDLEAFSKENWNCEDADQKEYEYFKRACRKQIVKGTVFCSWNQRLEEDEALMEDMYDVFDLCLYGPITNNENIPRSLNKIIEDGRSYVSMNDLIAYINETLYTPGERFYTYMKGLLDSNGIKNHAKNPFCVSLRSWLEERGAKEVSRARVGGKVLRKIFDITDLKSDIEDTMKEYEDSRETYRREPFYEHAPSDEFNKTVNQKVSFGGK